MGVHIPDGATARERSSIAIMEQVHASILPPDDSDVIEWSRGFRAGLAAAIGILTSEIRAEADEGEGAVEAWGKPPAPPPRSES